MKIFSKMLMLSNILILASFNLKAQNRDYVITAEGEKILCTITFPMFHENGVYKTAQMRETVPITTGEIKEYYVAKDRILHRQVLKRPDKPGSAVFMKVLENGKINLYEHNEVGLSVGATFMMASNSVIPGVGATSIPHWYITKGADSLQNLDVSEVIGINLTSKQKRMDVLARLIADNKEVYNKFIADDEFTLKEIRNIIHLYNTGKPTPRDYVVRKNKDTIFCAIEPASSTGPGRYRITSKDKFVKIDTSITAYFLAKDSSTFLLKTLPGEKRPKYVKSMVTGEINLYAYSLNNSAADNEATLYANKQQGELILLKDEFHKPGKNEKKAFADLISDDPGLAEKFTSLPYNFSSILDCVKMYDSDHLKQQ